MPPRLAGDECVVTTKVEMRGPVNFALMPGYHLRPEKDGPYNCNIAGGTPNGLWTTCEAYDDVTGMKSRLSPGHYELVATGTDAGNYSHISTASTSAAVTARALTVAAAGVNRV